MAKRNKAKFASKSRKSGLRVEALEQRQLLAAVTGGGTEVGSDIQHPNGNVYDQVLMTGSSVTVTADAGQVTRVSYVDTTGDIVQAEFAGKGTLTITLDDFKAAAPAANYNQPGVNYVTGTASFTIQGSDATTNFNVFSVGSGNAVNQSLFEGGKTGGNNFADVARLLIVSDPTNPGGFSNFGGIRAGNAVFSASTGVVGISAQNVNVQGPVIVGDINATDAGVPSVVFGTGSQFATLVVAGGDLAQTNSAVIQAQGFQGINSTSGTTSAGTSLPSQTITATIDADPTTAGNQALANGVVTLDDVTSIDLTGASQAEINAFFNGRTFTKALTVSGDLAVSQSISAAEFRQGVTFTGALAGTVTTTGGMGNVTVEGAVSGAISAGSIGNLTLNGGLSAVVAAKSIGDVTITGNLTGGITTDTDGNDAHTAGEGRIGNVSVSGNIADAAYVEGVLGIGNITVGGNITSNNTAQGGVFVTRSGASGDAFLGNIGTLTVTGDVDHGNTTTNLINITNRGTYGDITISGGGSVTDGGTVQVGKINVTTSLGSSTSAAGSISITETTTNKDVAFGGVFVGGSLGSIGGITITGGGNVAADLDLDGAITATGVNNGTITASGFGTIDVNAAIDAKGAGINLATVAGTDSTNSRIGINAAIGHLDRDLGPVVLNAGTTKSSITFTNDIIADDLSTVDITAATVNMTGGWGLRADKTAGAITITGAANLTRGDDDGSDNIVGNVDDVATGAAIDIDGTVASLTITGATTLNGAVTRLDALDAAPDADRMVVIKTGSITGALSLNNATFAGAAAVADPDATDAAVFGTAAVGSQIWIAGDLGSLVLNGTTTMTDNRFTSIVLDNNGSATDDIGSITAGRLLGSTTAGVNDIRASSVGDVNITASLTQDQTLITDFSLLVAPNGDATASNAESVSIDGSNLSSYAIGNITIQSNLALAFTGTTIFKGDNSFVSLGGIGNISVTGAVSGAQQSQLFAAATDAAWFAAGDTDGLLTPTFALEANVARYDSNADGTTEDNSAAPNFTGGTIAIGNVTVNALQSTTGGGYSGVNLVGGSDAAAGGSIEGFAVLSAVRVNGANGQAGDLVSLNTVGNSVVNAVDIDAQLKGTIGDVLISSNNAVGFRDEVTVATLVGTAGDHISAIVAATSVGKVQSVTADSGMNDAGEAVIVGDVNASEDNTVEDADAANQIVVVVV